MQNVLAVLFKNEADGLQMIAQLKEEVVTKHYTILEMALIKREGQAISIKDSKDSGITTGSTAAIGGLLGGMLGILGGPIGVLLMGSYGAMAGGLLGSMDTMDSVAMIEVVAYKLVDGDLALIALVDEDDESALDNRLNKFDCEIIRFDAAVVAHEVHEAELLHEEMERQAREKLRESRTDEYKHKIEEYRDNIASEFEKIKKRLKGEE